VKATTVAFVAANTVSITGSMDHIYNNTPTKQLGEKITAPSITVCIGIWLPELH
jgi:hypothetical protein